MRIAFTSPQATFACRSSRFDMNGCRYSLSGLFLAPGRILEICEPTSSSLGSPKYLEHILLQFLMTPSSLTDINASVTLSKITSIGVVVVSDWDSESDNDSVIVASILS